MLIVSCVSKYLLGSTLFTLVIYNDKCYSTSIEGFNPLTSIKNIILYVYFMKTFLKFLYVMKLFIIILTNFISQKKKTFNPYFNTRQYRVNGLFVFSYEIWAVLV